MKRLPGIRHLRWIWGTWRVIRHASAWGRIGIGTGEPAESDLQHLDAIWRGRA